MDHTSLEDDNICLRNAEDYLMTSASYVRRTESSGTRLWIAQTYQLQRCCDVYFIRYKPLTTWPVWNTLKLICKDRAWLNHELVKASVLMPCVPPRTKSEQAEIQSWMPLRTWVKLWNVLYHIFENVVDCKQHGKLYDEARFAEPNHFL
jgi:hypothetical protein